MGEDGGGGGRGGREKAHRCAVSRGLASQRGIQCRKVGEEMGREEGSLWIRTLETEGRKRVRR